jgi:hypothetical protein
MTGTLSPEQPAKPRGRLRRVGKRALQVFAALGLAVAGHIAFLAVRYGAPLPVAARGAFREYALVAIRLAVALHDPCPPRAAALGPAEGQPAGADWPPLDEVFPLGEPVAVEGGYAITAAEVHNERIARSPFPFAYQPHDEPRLHALARKYRLQEVLSRGKDEFEGLVLLRGWARSQFRRRDYQPAEPDFDALAILDRGSRGHGQPYQPRRHLDPCYFFPMLYCQSLLSVGHQGRIVSADHGMVEVWSNQHRKWALMDAELNHHFEKDGAPLNMGELVEEASAGPPYRVRIVRGGQGPGGENPTMAHLGVKELDVGTTLGWFLDRPLDLVELRNDWLTNHYFPGHPARSERSSLVFLHPKNRAPLPFSSRLRQTTRSTDEAYWTLNQAAIRTAPRPGRALALAFDTVTPNFNWFEVVVDGGAPCQSAAPSFEWRLHEGMNTLVVRAVNHFGVRGAPSVVRLSLSAKGHGP